MTSKLQIWNLAVALIRAKLIQSPDENSLEARECRNHYPQVIASLLEGPHDWGFIKTRIPLNETTNDRSQEWLFAYVLPSDMASPVMVLPDLDGLGISIPVPLAGNPYFEVWSTLEQDLSAPYIIEKGVLYTNTENATLVYVPDSVLEGQLSAKLADAVATELAGRIAMPVKGDKELRDKYLSEAETRMQRAIADDANRQPQNYPPYVSEAEIARQG